MISGALLYEWLRTHVSRRRSHITCLSTIMVIQGLPIADCVLTEFSTYTELSRPRWQPAPRKRRYSSTLPPLPPTHLRRWGHRPSRPPSSLHSQIIMTASPAGGRVLVSPTLVMSRVCKKKSKVKISPQTIFFISDPLSLLATHLTNYMFDGARADLTKALSLTPAFQVTHSFALASQTQLPSYNFGAIFANQKVCLVYLKCTCY